MPALPPCGIGAQVCDNLGACDMCLKLLPSAACPSRAESAQLPSCSLAATALIPLGGLCEGGGQCGTDNQANTCDGFYEVYERIACAFMPPSPPAS